jgi:hypothetical protein
MYLSAVLKLDQQLAIGDQSLAHYGPVLQKSLQAFGHGGLPTEAPRTLEDSSPHERGGDLYTAMGFHQPEYRRHDCPKFCREVCEDLTYFIIIYEESETCNVAGSGRNRY